MLEKEPTLQIVQRAVRGDGDAFASIFDRYFDAIYNYLYSLCNDGYLAEDLTQETFIRAHRNLHRLGPPFNVRAWLYQISHNLFVNHLESLKPTVPLDPDAPFASSEPGPEGHMLIGEWSGPVGSALRNLNPTYRE